MKSKPVIPRKLANRDVDETLNYYLSDGGDQAALGFIEDAVITNVNERGINGFSAPVFDASGAIVLALTMMGDSADLKQEDPAIARLSDAARRLSVRLGYRS